MTHTDDGGLQLETSQEIASALLLWLQNQGALLSIDADGFLQVDLNPCPGVRDHETADVVAKAILAVRGEIKVLLLRDRVVH